METLLTIAIVIVVFPYVAGPLLLWITGGRILPTHLELADPSAGLPSGAESHFWKTTHYFSSNGFQQAGDRVRESASNGLSSYKQLWRHGETGEVALVGAFLKESDAAFCNTFVAFLNDRGNGAMVSTSNFDPGARTNLDPAGTSRLSVHEQDLDKLRALHQGHIASLDSRTVRPLRVRDGFTLCQQMDASTRTLALSRQRYRTDGESLRITLWGAIYGIWINLPPLKSRFERQDRRLLEMAMRAGPASGASTTGLAA